MSAPTLLTHFNPRTDDYFEIYLDSDGELDFILHYVDRHGGPAMPYHTWQQVPPKHRGALEQVVAERSKAK